MKKIFEKVLYIGIGFTTAAVLMTGVSTAGTTVPGSADDPIVTMSYVEKRFQEFNDHLNLKIDEMNEQVAELENSQAGNGGETAVFEVISAEKGDQLYFDGSVEFILRAGSASVIASESGGIANLTAGYDLKTGEAVPLNHHLLVPKNDGRGILINEDAWIMVKGAYSIVTN